MPIRVYGSFSERGGPRYPEMYRGIIRGLYRAPLRDDIGVILRDTHMRKFQGYVGFGDQGLGLAMSLALGIKALGN